MPRTADGAAASVAVTGPGGPVDVEGLDDPLVRRLLELRSTGRAPTPQGEPVLSWTLTADGIAWSAQLYRTPDGPVVISDLQRQPVSIRAGSVDLLLADPRLR